MDILVALLAFAGALLAGITTGVLVGRLRDEPNGWLIAWSVATGALALSLAAIAVGHLTGFGALTFRAYQITGSLLAPLWLAAGTIQLLAERAATRFGVWLVGTAITVVGVVITMVDPISESFSKRLPVGSVHWDIWPEWLLRGVHGLVILTMLIALIVAVLRWRDGDDYDADNMNASAVVAPAGMAIAGAMELALPGIVVVALMAGTAGGVWYVVARPLAPYEDEEDEDYLDDEWEDPREGGRAAPAPEPARHPAAAAPPRRSGLGDLVAEYRAGEQGEAAHHAGPGRPEPAGDDFSGPATGQIMIGDQMSRYAGMQPPPPAPVEEDESMPATGVVLSGGELPISEELAAALGVGFSGASREAGRAEQRQSGSVKPSPGIYGLLTVFTLMDGSGEAFDKLAEETVEAVRQHEPDTLLFVCHSVKSAPLQRIIYELYRDEVGYAEHQRQPHIERFVTERQPLVLAANTIELKVNAAKVVPLPTRFR
ncbi:hypothetical protein TBS_20720 [Thermobispora bispora]|jgi:quinol monooxygenase YgiN|uniref:Antibiotic biosynthesis monooxygenase n=1 Tax=Thermobispora bispora (strain ATCC 19993 / DSM 43833 / CBS 139.67 / JCM 10125 / KCTC 9307 / NBRC 14880 / R51) TaxID=469371 RepID=D6Y3G0_THEBD|nr:hypothetical protein [Thermobispora bispora]MBO2474461.1 hypothetical protein [Actinomycetales bacterium]MDI9582175.1 hypothetical protein [Thermobispora sp.]ADG86989.1 hypothetical protein Tbis_0258 [Thermobispora bispora DSM 43833]MBX6168093.1 hypothetical protein [Thermobispora bispora]QSI46969.1 hypothetical protein CYL17_03185 [Thermobispora bispora]